MIILVQEYKTIPQKTAYCCILCSLIKNNKRNKLIWILFLSVNSLGNDKFMFTLQVSLQNYFQFFSFPKQVKQLALNIFWTKQKKYYKTIVPLPWQR